jgi:hypothetical protein
MPEWRARIEAERKGSAAVPIQSMYSAGLKT